MEEIRNDQRSRTPIIIWGALIWSMVVYIFVGYQNAKDRVPVESFIQDQRSHILLLAALAAIVIGFFLSQRIISYNRHYVPTLPADQRTTQAISSFMVPFLIRMAVLESLGLMGLIMTMNTGDFMAVAGLSGITIIGQILLFPSPSRIANWSGLHG